MTKRQRHDPANDSLPAYGLRDDDFDDRLRSQPRLTPQPKKAPNTLTRRRKLAADGEDDVHDDERALYQLRAIEHYAVDPAEWLKDNSMTQTEVALRLGRYLIASGLACAKVIVTLAGSELTHREKPQFPVDRFLIEVLGFSPKRIRKDSWLGTYILKGHEQPLVLVDHDRHNGHVETRLAGRERLFVLPSRGLLASTRSSAEVKWVQNAIGRIATAKLGPRDLFAIAVPRSKQFSKMAVIFRGREGVNRMRLLILTVDRHNGDVNGLPSSARQS